MTVRDIAYVALMATSVGVGAWLARRDPHRAPMRGRERVLVTLFAIGFGSFGAKLPFFFDDPEAFHSGRAFLDNGRTLTLGLGFGYLGVEIAKLALGLRVKTGDGIAMPLAVSVAIGRLACFVAGCCFGASTDLPWGVRFHDDVPRHPTQLYEAAFHALAAIALSIAGRRGAFPRQRIKLYFMSYFAYRFVSEWLRPEPRVALGLTFYQWASLGLFAVFAALYALDAARPALPADAAELSLPRAAGDG